MSRPQVLVVGGGIAGLATAWSLGTDLDVTVVESTSRLGGKIATTTFRGHPLDLGPDAFIVRNRAALDLCEELGISDQLIAPSTKSAAIYSRRDLHPFPKGLVFGIPTDLQALYRSHIVGLWGVIRILRDRFAHTPVLPRHLADAITGGETDLTVAEIFTNRLGDRVVAALIEPLIGGINASDVRMLSFASSMPQIFTQLIDQPSIMRALVRPVSSDPQASGSIFRGLHRGMASLVDALSGQLVDRGVTISRGEEITGITLELDGRYRVASSAGTRTTDAVVLATPAFASAALVRELSHELSMALMEIPYASVATVTFAWREEDVPTRIGTRLRVLVESRSLEAPGPSTESLLPGSGVLIARDRGTMTTATSFTSTKWPRSAPHGEVIIRASLGRHNDDRAALLNDRELVKAIRSEIADVLKIDREPLDVVVQRWPHSFPQYVSGHEKRVRRIDALADSVGIDLVGAAYHGIGIPACIAHARLVGAKVRQRLA